jgi:nicotinate phosphoribosyltransferase
MSGKRLFHIASEDEIKRGETTDVYFSRTVEILKVSNIHKKVKMEVYSNKLPDGWGWAVLAGVEEVCNLLSGLRVDVRCLPEGTIFEEDVPVLQISGEYTEFAIYETAILGLLCQASGVATKSARTRIAAGERLLLSFGARRMHPAVSLMVDRSCFMGGCDGVAVVKSAQFLGIEPSGTMPHALILILKDPVKAFRRFNEIEPKEIKRVALIDTFGDEKFEAIEAARSLGEDLFAVRLDTPSSRRGDFKKILKEVRWELDIRGYRDVKIFVSGGLNEYIIKEINEFADAYGVGSSLSNAPVVDFSMDIVEVEGEPLAKRGKHSGSKKVYRCKRCLRKIVLFEQEKPNGRCSCGGEIESVLREVIKGGKLLMKLPSIFEIKDYVRHQITVLDCQI